MGVNNANLLSITLLNQVRTAKLCLINSRSVCNKAEFLVDYITSHDIDIMCITETWLRSEDTASASAITPSGYHLEHAARSNGRGGGVGVLFRSSFHIDHSQLWPASSFECLDLQLRCQSVSSTLRLFVVYRPPSSSRNSQPFAIFLTEFRDLIERVAMESGIIILGDFNVAYGDNNDAHARALHDILSDANLRQNVTDATHQQGNVLDLVITASSSSPITQTSVDALITDHFAILCDLVPIKPRPLRKHITYRRYGSIDNDSFTKDICECAFINEPACDVSDLYDQYCSELGDLIDHLAPTMDRVVTERPHTPWWNHDLDEMRRQVRLREREWRRNRTDDRRLCYTLLRDEYCRLLASTKAAFYSLEIESASYDNRAMFGIANHLLGRKCGSVLPHDSGGPTAVANRFAHHFVDKLSLISSQIQSTPAGGDNTQACITPSFLLSFQPATLSDVMALINSGKTKSSKIDPLPISLLKANTAALAPFFVNLINMSYTCCTVPARLKHAVVTPLLKRPGLPTDNFSNYRPISNLPYASKLLERHVSAQLRLHLQNNNIEDPFQSAYRPSHSVETAIVCIQDDVLRSLDARKHVALVLLDLSAAFDTIDHCILLEELHRIGVRGDALRWMSSYLTDRTQCVSVDDHLSCEIRLQHGVPQGSVLGPLLFSLYCAGLSEVFIKYGIRYHVYADDTQLYVDFPRGDSASAVDRIRRCVIDVKAWLASRCLLLNEKKTEAILFAAPNNRIPQPPPLCIDVCGCTIIASTNIRDLGVQLDSTMSMAAHVSRTCRTAYAQLRCINRIRSSLPVSARKTLVHALVTSKLDFGNAALYGITGTLLHIFEMVQRAAARVVLGLRRRDQHSMTAALQQLHWVPVAYRIQFKLLTLVHGAIHANTPRYLADRVSAYVPCRSLRSTDQSLLVVPRVNLERFGRRAFSCAGPSLWNALPLVLRTEQDVERFRRDLKTYLFKQAFM